MGTLSAEGMVDALCQTMTTLVRNDGPDLSARQLGVLLIRYLDTKAQTVRGIAATLDVAKPAISRALDRLTELDLAGHAIDPADRRSIVVKRTSRDVSFINDLRMIMAAAEKKKDAVMNRDDVVIEPALPIQ